MGTAHWLFMQTHLVIASLLVWLNMSACAPAGDPSEPASFADAAHDLSDQQAKVQPVVPPAEPPVGPPAVPEPPVSTPAEDPAAEDPVTAVPPVVIDPPRDAGLALSAVHQALVAPGAHELSVTASAAFATRANLRITFAAPIVASSLGGFTCDESHCDLEVELAAAPQSTTVHWSFAAQSAANAPLTVTLTALGAASDSSAATLPLPLTVTQAVLSDDFAAPSIANAWTDDDPARHDLLAQSDGRLALQATPATGMGWYREDRGPLLYQRVSGDFRVDVAMRIERIGRTPGTAFGQFSSAGLILRSRPSTVNAQRWVVYNYGYQSDLLSAQANERWATELKWTRDPPSAGGESLSSLFLNRHSLGQQNVELRACRIGGELRFYLRAEGSTIFTEEHFVDAGTAGLFDAADTLPMGEPTLWMPSQTPLRFTPAMLSDELDVGLMANSGFGLHEARASFDFIHFSDIQSFSDCEL